MVFGARERRCWINCLWEPPQNISIITRWLSGGWLSGTDILSRCREYQSGVFGHGNTKYRGDTRSVDFKSDILDM